METTFLPIRILSLLLLYFTSDSCIANRVCSWTNSNEVFHNAVTVVHVNCTEGKLDWRRPKGALMVEVVPFSDSVDSNPWQLCIRPKSKYIDDILLSYLENDTLKALTRAKTTIDIVFCATTNGPSLKLYVELKPGGSKIYGSRASFYYSVVKKFKTPTMIDKQQRRLQCEPCQTKYLLESFCSADLIFKGVLSSNGRNFMRFTIEQFVRKPITDDGDVFTTQKDEIKTRALIETPDGCVLSKNLSSLATEEFLVIAKMHLGRAQMVCAPLWSDWLNVRHRTLLSSNATLMPCDVT